MLLITHRWALLNVDLVCVVLCVTIGLFPTGLVPRDVL